MPTGSILFSLQSKLILAFSAVALAALVLAASVFVVVRRGEQEQQELDRVIATSPAIYALFYLLQAQGADVPQLAAFVDGAAEEFDVRMFLVDRRLARVEADSEGHLTGEELALPSDLSVRQQTGFRPYVSWKPESGSPGSDLILVSALTILPLY